MTRATSLLDECLRYGMSYPCGYSGRASVMLGFVLLLAFATTSCIIEFLRIHARCAGFHHLVPRCDLVCLQTAMPQLRHPHFQSNPPNSSAMEIYPLLFLCILQLVFFLAARSFSGSSSSWGLMKAIGCHRRGRANRHADFVKVQMENVLFSRSHLQQDVPAATNENFWMNEEQLAYDTQAEERSSICCGTIGFGDKEREDCPR